MKYTIKIDAEGEGNLALAHALTLLCAQLLFPCPSILTGGWTLGNGMYAVIREEEGEE